MWLRSVAEWGAYRVILDSRASRCLAEIRRIDDGTLVTAMPELPACTTAEAIEWAAEQLRRRGAVAFIDGKHHPLVDFLVFTERTK